MSSALSVKDSLHRLADQLPENATWRDVLYEAYVRQEIEDGLREDNAGEFASDQEVQSAFAQWGVTIETQVD